jgi:hypothetical protein
MEASQNSAVSAAARQLGFRTADVVVEGVAAGAPADGRLREGDVLRTIDGRPLRDAADLRAAVSAGEVGDAVRIGLERDGRSSTVELRSAASDDDGEPRPVIGVVTREEPVDAPFDVEITLEDVGGPSAGLMFALGILDKLGEPSLTGGAYIAGTGEISAQGEVGPIGGISQKLVAAKAKGVDAFLVPQGNCAEAVLSAPDGLPLVEVGSLAQALTALEALRDGRAARALPRAEPAPVRGGSALVERRQQRAGQRRREVRPVTRSSCSGVAPRRRSTHACGRRGHADDHPHVAPLGVLGGRGAGSSTSAIAASAAGGRRAPRARARRRGPPRRRRATPAARRAARRRGAPGDRRQRRRITGDQAHRRGQLGLGPQQLLGLHQGEQLRRLVPAGLRDVALDLADHGLQGEVRGSPERSWLHPRGSSLAGGTGSGVQGLNQEKSDEKRWLCPSALQARDSRPAPGSWGRSWWCSPSCCCWAGWSSRC